MAFQEILNGQIRRRKADQFCDFAIFSTDGEMVGVAAVMDVARGISQGAFLSYRIYNNHWRKGYGKEAVRAVIDIGFKDIKLHRLEAGIEPNNIQH